MAARPAPDSAGSSGARARSQGDWVGREVEGRYVIIDRLGEGGMGVVYVAEHLHLKRRVAFKVIHPDLAAHEELLLRFKREALATGQLDHPHIASAIDFGELPDGGAFMVMPLVRGHSLQTELESRGKLDYRRAARLGAQIADALSAAHTMGIVHRDLKPDNVLIEERADGSEAAKVLDFGVASLAGGPQAPGMEARPLTQAGTILGTPGYMSPEQATAGEVDHRTDLYALGVILWELCRGERLFDGETITEIFSKQFKSLPAALELGLQPSARALSALVGQLLAWNKNDRPSSAAEVRDALRRIAETPDPRLPLPDVGPLLARVRPLAARLRSEVGTLVKRHPKQAFAGAAALLIALPLLLIVATRDGGETLTPAVEDATSAEPLPAKAATGKAASTRASRQSEPKPKEAKPKRSEPAADAPRSEEAEEHAPPAGSLDDAEQLLLHSRSRDTRRGAAKLVLRQGSEAPTYLQLVADLELADRCATRKEVLAKMRAQPDPRVLPALDRLAAQPPRGCGLLRLSDCLACVRRDLDQTIEVLAPLQGR